MEDLIYTRESCLPADLCKHIIKKFEDSQDKGSGISGGGLNHSVKKSTDLIFTAKPKTRNGLTYMIISG